MAHPLSPRSGNYRFLFAVVKVHGAARSGQRWTESMCEVRMERVHDGRVLPTCEFYSAVLAAT